MSFFDLLLLRVMGHIHTEPGQHDHTISGFIIRVDGSEPKILLHKHKKLGVYLQFGGHIELDENPWQALTHELLEESGYGLDQLEILQPKIRMKNTEEASQHPVPISYNTHRFNDDHLHIDVSYAFVTHEEPGHAVAEDESGEMELFTRAEISKLTSKDTFDNLKKICEFIFDEVLPNWEQVPAVDCN